MITRIIATIGEEALRSAPKELIDILIKKGIKHFRFNLSKCKDYDDLKYLAEAVQKVKSEYGNDIYMMVDFPYPKGKVRLSNPQENLIYIKKNDIITIESSNSRTHRISAFISNVEDIDEFVGDKERYIYADGEVSFHILSKSKEDKNIVLKADNDGKMYSNKSLSFGRMLSSQIKLEQLVEIISICKSDAIALSLVSDADSIIKVKDVLLDSSIDLYSKIETQESIHNISEISKISNILVGRGDLLLNSNICQLYDLQKKAIIEAKKNNRYTAVATGILSSMAQNYMPTQSEMIDIAVLKQLAPDYIILNSALIRGDNINRVIDIIREA